MDDSKQWWRSRTLWGVIVAALAQILERTGVLTLDEAAQQELVGIALEVATGLGLLVAFVGRLVARKPIAAPSMPIDKLPPPGAAAAILLLVLGGCAGANDKAAEFGARIGEAADQGSPVKATIDGLVPLPVSSTGISSLEARTARACLVAAAAGDLVAAPARQANAIKPDEALGAVLRLDATCAAALATDKRWVNVTLYDVAEDIVAVVGVAARQRGLAIAPLVATLNPLGLIDQAVSVMSQVGRGAALLADIRQAFKDLGADQATIEELRTAARGRLARNRGLVQAMLGIPPAAATGPP